MRILLMAALCCFSAVSQAQIQTQTRSIPKPMAAGVPAKNIQAYQIFDAQGKKDYHIDHARSGDLVVIAHADSWFTYYFWLDDAKAPDYARCVDIHRKPGYDPVELVLDPKIKFPLVTVGSKVLKKKLGFRYLMDVIPLDATLVKGAHGRIPESDLDKPLLVGNPSLISDEKIQPTDPIR